MVFQDLIFFLLNDEVTLEFLLIHLLFHAYLFDPILQFIVIFLIVKQDLFFFFLQQNDELFLHLFRGKLFLILFKIWLIQILYQESSFFFIYFLVINWTKKGFTFLFDAILLLFSPLPDFGLQLEVFFGFESRKIRKG